MSQSQFSKVTDLSRFNWKGWLLLLITVVIMLTGIIKALDDGGTYSLDQRGTRRIIGFLCAFAAFGGFIVVAAILHQLGISIYRQGVDPWENGFVQDSGGTVSSFGTTKVISDETGEGDQTSLAAEVLPKVSNGEALKDLSDII